MSKELLNELSPEEQGLVQMHRDGLRAIWWGLDDFEQQAQAFEDEYPIKKYDRDKFPEALDRMIYKHDAGYGVSWSEVNYYLNEYCLIEKEDEI